MKNKVFVGKYSLSFKKDYSGYFIPDKYDCILNEDGTIQGKEISHNSKEPLGRCLFMFILYSKASGVEYDNETGVRGEGWLDIPQWIIAIIVIRHLLLLDSEDIISAISRQIGKSHISRMIVSFSITFIPLFVKITSMRWFSTLCSFKNDTAEDQLGKTHPHILDAIELYNKLYPNKPLEYDCMVEDKGVRRKLKWNTKLIEINRSINGKSIPYSSLDILGLDKNTKNPGYTSHLIFVDEGQDINAEAFRNNVRPFTTSTGGICFTIGTANNEPESLLRDLYVGEIVPDDCRIFCNAEEAIRYKEFVNKEHSEKYRRKFNKEVKDKGLHSDYIQTQYFVNFNIVGDNFTSLERLKNNNLFLGDIELDFMCEKHEYKIGAVDPALVNDMAGMVCGVSRFGDASVINELKNVIILHDKNTEKKSPKELVDKIAKHCVAQKLDYLILDTTGNQKDRAYYLYTKFRKIGCKTMIIPFDYSSSNKKTMMGYLEDSIYNQSIILPKEQYRYTDVAYGELIKQILYLKKTRTTSGNIQYKAPEGRDFYDDLSMSLSQFNYALEYIRRCISKNTIVDLGEGAKYYIKYNKYESDKIEKKIEVRSSWLGM